MTPNPNNLTLSKDAMAGPGGENGQTTGKERPSSVRVVMAGSAGIPAINDLTMKWKTEGFGKERNATKLAGLVYEMGEGDKTDVTLDKFQIAHETPGNLPVSLVHALAGAIDASKLPKPDTPPQFATVCFSLPTINSAKDIEGNQQQWDEIFKVASERQLTIELALNGADESAREAVETLIGKSWDNESAQAKQAGTDEELNSKGVRFVLDSLASPPLDQSGAQLLRSKEFQSWSDFVSRLALHPRVYLKLSPLPLPGIVPASLTTYRRPVDVIGNNVPLPGATTLGQTARAAGDAAVQALQSAQGGTANNDEGSAQDEQKQRLRVFLETALDAFGDERLLWTSYLASGSATANAGGEGLSEPEQWFETVLECLNKVGANQDGIDNIFSNNISRCYRT